MGSPGPATSETRLTSRGIRELEDGETEETISPMKFTRGFGGVRDGGGPDYDWDEASPGRGSRSAVESREYFLATIPIASCCLKYCSLSARSL